MVLFLPERGIDHAIGSDLVFSANASRLRGQLLDHSVLAFLVERLKPRHLFLGPLPPLGEPEQFGNPIEQRLCVPVGSPEARNLVRISRDSMSSRLFPLTRTPSRFAIAELSPVFDVSFCAVFEM